MLEISNRNSNPYPEQKLAQTASDSLTGEGKSSTEQAAYKGDSRGSKSNDTKSNTEESKSQENQVALKKSGLTDNSGGNNSSGSTPQQFNSRQQPVMMSPV